MPLCRHPGHAHKVCSLYRPPFLFPHLRRPPFDCTQTPSHQSLLHTLIIPDTLNNTPFYQYNRQIKLKYRYPSRHTRSVGTHKHTLRYIPTCLDLSSTRMTIHVGFSLQALLWTLHRRTPTNSLQKSTEPSVLIERPGSSTKPLSTHLWRELQQVM